MKHSLHSRTHLIREAISLGRASRGERTGGEDLSEAQLAQQTHLIREAISLGRASRGERTGGEDLSEAQLAQQNTPD